MVKRKRIGLSYSYNENWIGGTYYIENIIQALNQLEDNEKPQLTIIAPDKKTFKTVSRKTEYPYLTFQYSTGESNFTFKLVNSISHRLFKKPIFSRYIRNLEAVFPYYKCDQYKLVKNRIYWIPDFQELIIPSFFKKQEVEGRLNSHKQIVESSDFLVLSSFDALQHLNSFYPDYKVTVKVVPFAVTHPKLDFRNTKTLISKFNLSERYFICSNQFWKHKNHPVILRAFKRLKEEGKLDFQLALTGKPFDYRNPEYYQELQDFVKEHNLEEEIKFLGFIRRDEQLLLMSNSIGIIQPSLFEGWSTVVEDAKALNKSLIVSEINVHKEQLAGSNALFFPPEDDEVLKKLLNIAVGQNKSLYAKNTYNDTIKKFARNFLRVTEKNK